MDVEKIKELIKADKDTTLSSYRRYPVRFIFTDLDQKIQDDLLNLLDGEDCDFVDLRECLSNEDGWVTKGELLRIAKNASKEKDTFILGFTELIRFYSNVELESTLLSLVGDIENNLSDETHSRRRIYFICFAMKEYIYEILKEKFHRFDVYNPFLNEDFNFSGSYREICFADNSLEVISNKNVILKTKDWLGLYKNSALLDYNRPIISYSRNLYNWYEKASPDNAFQVEVIRDYKRLLNKVYGTNIVYRVVEGEDLYWVELSKEYEKYEYGTDFYKVFLKITGLSSLDNKALLEKWFSTESAFIRWIVREYIIAYFGDSYLAYVFRGEGDLSKDRLLQNIWESAFDDISNEMKAGRNELLDILQKYSDFYVPEKKIEDHLNFLIKDYMGFDDSLGEWQFNANWDSVNLDTRRSRLGEYFKKDLKPVLSGKSIAEKEHIIFLLGLDGIGAFEIKEAYPSLYDYLYSGSKLGDISWINEYFDEYRKSKLRAKDTDRLKELVSEKNKDEDTFFSWYYSLEQQDSVIKSIRKNADVYILDGVGGEYLPIIVSYLEKNGYECETTRYATCHLPSITEVNKKFLGDDNTWIIDFDKNVVHGEIYKTAHSIQKAIAMIEKILSDILSKQGGKPFVISADHGATARSRWTKPKKKYSFKEAHHEGRCCEVEKGKTDNNEDYITYDDPNFVNGWRIALKDISLDETPKYEDHGGATVEEVIVPVIFAKAKNDNSKIIYHVFAIKDQVTGLDRRVEFEITPEPQKVELIEELGEKHELVFEDGKWVSELSSGIQQKVFVRIDNRDFEFVIKSSRSTMMGGDGDGFDD